MGMQVGSGKLFDAQVIPVGGSGSVSGYGNISGKDQITLKLVADDSCTAKVYYGDGDPTNTNTKWYPSPTTAIATISLTANTPVTFQERINSGWIKVDIAKQGAKTPTVTVAFDTKAEQ